MSERENYPLAPLRFKVITLYLFVIINKNLWNLSSVSYWRVCVHCHSHFSSLIYSIALHHVGEILVPSLACSLLLCLFSDPSCLALKILGAELYVTMSRPFCELLGYVACGHVLKAITGVKLLSGSPTLPACALCSIEPLLLYCSIYKRKH